MALLVVQGAPHAAFCGEPGTLAEAAMNDDLAAMNALMKKGANPNVHGPFGTPALHWRVHVDDVVSTRRLLKGGAILRWSPCC
jgi:hypothetical protein